MFFEIDRMTADSEYEFRGFLPPYWANFPYFKLGFAPYQ
jgi:hypothetical protein